MSNETPDHDCPPPTFHLIPTLIAIGGTFLLGAAAAVIFLVVF